MPPIDSAKLLDAACQWMLDRNWHQLMGKLGSYTQSLYHHTAAQIGFLLALRPLLCRNTGPNLTEDQFLAVFSGSLCHDAGKANPEWQRALLHRTKLPHHVDDKLANSVVADWVTRLGMSEYSGLVPTVTAAIGLHHKATQGVASTLDKLLHGGQTDPRWRELADLVEAADKISSSTNIAEAAEIAGSWFGDGRPFPAVAATFHQVQVLRGVSTTLIHKAYQESHLDAGWTPAIHLADGTLYFSSTGAAVPVTECDIRAKLVPLFTRLLSETDLPQQVVGDFRLDLMPKPELFDSGQFSEYLKVAATRNKAANFRRNNRGADGAYSDAFRNSATKYKSFFCASHWAWRTTATDAGDAENLGILFERFVMAVPLASMFRFFKVAVLDDKIISEENWPLDDTQVAAIESFVARKKGDEEQKAGVREKEAVKTRNQAKKQWLEAVKQTYEEQFGAGSFDDLASVTNDSAINLAKAVDYFLDQDVASTDGKSVKWSSKTPSEQETEVRDRLDKIFKSSIAGLPQGVLTSGLDGVKLAEVFLEDVQLRGLARHIEVEARYESYLSAKQDGQDLAFCPYSNEPTQVGNGTGNDLGVSTDGHSNRLPMQGKTWKTWSRGVPMAPASRYEFMLRRLILGRPTEQLIVLLPPAQLGAFEGARLVSQVGQLEETIALYSGEFSPDPARRFSFSLTELIAAKTQRSLAAPLTDLLGYASSVATTQKHKRAFEKSLREVFSGSIESLNEDCETSFTDWNDALDALFTGQSDQAKLAFKNSDEVRMRRKVSLSLTTQGRFVCQTPNMILALLPNAVSMNKESDVNAAIRQLFLSLVLNNALGVAIAIIQPDEALTFSGCEGSVLVPGNPALRAEVARVRRSQAAAGNPPGVPPTHGWLLPHETLPWLKALAALHTLGREHSNQSGKSISVFPSRSAFYDILSARSAGFVLRRMENKLGRSLSVDEMHQLETLQAFVG
jgi:hypothetical protein